MKSLIFLSLTTLLFSSCAFKKDESASLTIKFADIKNYKVNFKNRATDPFDGTEPKTIGEHYCYAVIISSPLTKTDSANTCIGRDNLTTVSRPEIFVGYANVDKPITINNILPGKEKIIQIWGHNVQKVPKNGTTPLPLYKCPTVEEIRNIYGETLKDLFYGPRLIGHTTVDIVPGNQNVQVNVSLNESKQIRDCKGPIFDDLWPDDGGGDGDHDGNIIHPNIYYLWPQDGDTISNHLHYEIDFYEPLNQSTLTHNTTSGTCTGNIQISKDNFATCEGISKYTGEESNYTYLGLDLNGDLQVGATYKLKLKTGIIAGTTNITQYVSTLGNAVINRCNGITATNYDDVGIGTMDEPFLICSKQQFESLKAAIIAEEANSKKVLMVGQNIDMTGFTGCLGNDAHPFKGTLEGDGASLSNLDLITDDYGGAASSFGFICKLQGDGTMDDFEDGVVRHLNFQNFNLAGGDLIVDGVGLIGRVVNGYVDGVYIGSGEVNTPTISEVGGLVGLFEDGMIMNSGVQIYVQGASMVGGMIGHMVLGTVTGAHKGNSTIGTGTVGGIIGYAADGDISDCNGYGTINNTGDNTGGIVGQANSFNVYNCTFQGTVSGANSSGGIIGNAGPGNVVTYAFNKYSPGEYIRATSSNAGGIVGTGEPTITISINEGNIESEFNTGGIIGNMNSAGHIEDCYNSGMISGTGSGQSTGGIAGNAMGSGNIAKSVNIGSITGDTNVGGLVGMGGMSLAHCASTGTVNGNSAVGRVSGSGTPDATNYFWGGSSCATSCNTDGSMRSNIADLYNTTLAPYTNGSDNWDFTNTWEARSNMVPRPIF